MSVSVYGFIQGSPDRDSAAQDTHNQLQLQALPEFGCYLTKELFSFVPYSRAHAYYGSHIHFAAGYKDLYCLDGEWVEEFESLLSKLYWNKAELILTWSRERYVWWSDYSYDVPGNAPNKILGRSRFESAWDLKEIAWDS